LSKQPLVVTVALEYHNWPVQRGS